VDARLPDGTRFHAVLPPIAGRGTCLSLRTFRPRAFTVAELVDAGTLAPGAAALLRAVVAARLAFLVTGGTGSGKTTLLAALLGLVPPVERIGLVEDAAELRPDHPHVVPLQARPANADGAGEVTLRDLVRQALRMRPDRIVVGECRGAEVVELLTALNTGHDGGAGTLHANSPADVPARLEALAATGGLGRDALHSQLAAALHCVVHVRRGPAGRVVDEVCVLRPGPDGRVAPVAAWRRDGGPAPGAGFLGELLRRRDVEVPDAR
jgi:pilus assembly protein CpaF